MAALRLAGLAAVLLAVGCHRGPQLARVTGAVTVGGKPVTAGTISFIPAAGKAAVGTIGPDGRYSLTTFTADDGALVGDHKVTIHATTVGAGTMQYASLEDELKGAKGKVLVPGKVDWVVPERYSALATTDLTATVGPGDQTIDFNLPAK
ncbi:MAG TPA: hypothetical protein VGF55_04885 [Gemmataceae bacterium]|jgi:hypothetical protein